MVSFTPWQPDTLLVAAATEDPRPFAWSDKLERLAESWDLDIVLQTSATMVLGYERVKSMAPPWLQQRISGFTDEKIR